METSKSQLQGKTCLALWVYYGSVRISRTKENIGQLQAYTSRNQVSYFIVYQEIMFSNLLLRYKPHLDMIIIFITYNCYQ